MPIRYDSGFPMMKSIQHSPIKRHTRRKLETLQRSPIGRETPGLCVAEDLFDFG